MSGWRFCPLKDDPKAGLLVSPGGQPTAAFFLTPIEARWQALNNEEPPKKVHRGLGR